MNTVDSILSELTCGSCGNRYHGTHRCSLTYPVAVPLDCSTATIGFSPSPPRTIEGRLQTIEDLVTNLPRMLVDATADIDEIRVRLGVIEGTLLCLGERYLD